MRSSSRPGCPRGEVSSVLAPDSAACSDQRFRVAHGCVRRERPQPAGGDQSHRRHLGGEPQLRQSLRGLGGGFSKPTGWLKGTGAPGGCTRDLVHRFYQEQYQINGGRQDHYVTGSDAIGLAMGVYDTRSLPIYSYLHQPGHPHYAIADDFFQSAFPGVLPKSPMADRCRNTDICRSACESSCPC